MFDHYRKVNFGADGMSINDDMYDDGDYGDSIGDNTVVPVVLSKMVVPIVLSKVV